MGTVSGATIALLAFPLGLGSAQPTPRPEPQPLDSANLTAWLDSLVPAALRDGAIPGAVVVVVKDGRILTQRGYGLADVARRIPMDPTHTLVGVGSVSKLFAWTAVMQQVQAGKLDLDRDIGEYLGFAIPPAFGKPITLRHLMTHTGGFEERKFRHYRVPRPLREHLLGTPVPERIFPPGEVVAYSNYGSMVAGYVVERVTGERFLDYVDRRVLGLLGMTRSTLRKPVPSPLAQDLAQSYGTGPEDPNPPDALDHEEPAGDPSGHLVTTGSDIARFMLAYLQHGRLESTVLLDSATVALMHTPVVEPVPGGNPLTLGWFRTDWNGERVLAHAGVIEGFHADLELLMDRGVGWFLAVNGDGASRGLFGTGHHFVTSAFRRFVERYYPAPPAPDQPTAPTAIEHARLMAGEYQMSRRGSGDFTEVEDLIARGAMALVITANPDGTITTPPILDFENGRPRTWREVGPFQWREVGGPGWLDVKVENGRVVALLPRDLLSFILQPVPAAKRAMPNIFRAFGSIAILGLTVLWWPVAAIVQRRSARPPPAGLATVRRAALVGLLYWLGWATILATGVASMEGGETWIRAAQVVGVAALIATVAALKGAWAAWRAKTNWVAIGTAIFVTVAMLQTIWFSFGFHLLSRRLVY